MVFFVLFVGFLARYAEDVEATDSLTEQRLMRASAEEERDVQFIGRLNLSSALSSWAPFPSTTDCGSIRSDIRK